MKKYITLLLAVAMSNLAMAQIEKAEIIATGLTCSMCSNAIYKQLHRNPEIDKVEANLNTNTFTVYFKKGNTVKPIDLRLNVEEAGFYIGSLTVYLPTNTIIVNGIKTFAQGKTNFEILEGTFAKNTKLIKAKIFDKGFVTTKEYKKIAKGFNSTLSVMSDGQELYHVKIMQ